MKGPGQLRLFYWIPYPAQGSHSPVLTQIRMHKDAKEFGNCFFLFAFSWLWVILVLIDG
jgi:hypothetical protein